jgi:cobalt-zinc-cadmium resistance protein CzcA
VNNNSNTGGGFYSQGGQFNYVRGLGLLREHEDIGEVPVGSAERRAGAHQRHRPCVIGNAPRLGIFGFKRMTTPWKA